MKKIIIKTTTLAAFLFFVCVANAQKESIEKCKDLPMFERMENFDIERCRENLEAYEFMINDNDFHTIEGKVTEIIYSFNGENGARKPNISQVIKHYENATENFTGIRVYPNSSDYGSQTAATFYYIKDSIECWLGIYDLDNDPVSEYKFVLLTRKSTQDEVTSKQIYDAIDSGNSIPLYINFQSWHAGIKTESLVVVEELCKMLMSNPSLKIIIEGHTDSEGDKIVNQILSDRRAMSVKHALMVKGIALDRMKVVGYGETRPIGDNSTEEGKAKNRRVEIKKVDDTL